MAGVLELTVTAELAALRPLWDGHDLEDVVLRALDLVVDANGDLDVWFAVGAGGLEGHAGPVGRFARRSGIEMLASQQVSDDVVVVPADQAVELCRGFCRREPQTVRAHLAAEERRIEQGGSAPGGREVASRARALVRAWTDGR